MPLYPGYQSPLDDRVNVGQFAPPRMFTTSHTGGPASGEIHLAYFTADKTETISNITTWTGDTAAAATPTICRLGVWTVGADDSLTALAASTTNDTTLWATTFTKYIKPLTASFTKLAGQRYAAGLICVTAGTTPTFQGAIVGGTTSESNILFTTPAGFAIATGQANLPTTLVIGSLDVNRISPAYYLS